MAARLPPGIVVRAAEAIRALLASPETARGKATIECKRAGRCRVRSKKRRPPKFAQGGIVGPVVYCAAVMSFNEINRVVRRTGVPGGYLPAARYE